MIKTAVARRYAKALFELLDEADVELTRAALAGLGQAVSTSQPLRHAMATPAFGRDDKVSVLSELGRRFGSPPTGEQFLAQLVKQNRVGLLPDIAEAFARLADERKGKQQVSVWSASPMDAAEQDRLRTRLRDILKRDVDITFASNPAQLAGLHIRIGSTVIDGTLRGRLTAMQSLLTKE
ncbi:MAG: ATP synthase F1 subunit delta [Nitrospirota bacterium]